MWTIFVIKHIPEKLYTDASQQASNHSLFVKTGQKKEEKKKLTS